MPTSSMNGEDAILFSVMDRAARIYSYSWLIEWSTSSFYVKSTYEPLQLMKVSIHGSDPKHLNKQHFRLDFDHKQPATKAAHAGGAWTEDGVELPLYFNGRQVTKRAKHIVRFAVGSEMFATGTPSAPVPNRKAKATLHASLSAPQPGKVVHLDLFLSSVRPYWPTEKKVRAHDAGMGPIANSAGLYLTAVNYQEPASKEPDPFGDIRGGEPIDQCVRAIGETVDPAGFLWVCEKMIPRSKFAPPLPPRVPGGAPSSVAPPDTAFPG
jgi:hypothetical protein